MTRLPRILHSQNLLYQTPQLLTRMYGIGLAIKFLKLVLGFTQISQQPSNLDSILQEYGICDEIVVKKIIDKYDIILPSRTKLGMSIASHYLLNHLREDFEIMIDVILDKYPDYKLNIDRTFYRNNKMYAFNMFIYRCENRIYGPIRFFCWNGDEVPTRFE